MDRIWLTLFFFALSSTVRADFVVDCIDGCLETPPEDRTVNLLLIDDQADSIKLRWRTGLTLDPNRPFLLTAGNPNETDALVRRGMLAFEDVDGMQTAVHEFSVNEIGHETFVATLLRQGRQPSEIADWRAFRIKYGRDIDADRDGLPMVSGHSIDAEIEYLQVSSGRGDLPVSRGGTDKIWWRVPQQYSRQDIDIDGNSTGVPGIGVLISPVWEATDQSWLDSLADNLREVRGRVLDFEDFTFQQSPPRTVDLGGQIGQVVLKHYYSVITIHTNATQKNFSARDLGRSGNRVFFSHETSANFNQKTDPRLWSSYSRREYSADPKMLALIQNSVSDSGTVPGLVNIQQDDGDGGMVTYRVAFKARVQPWGGDANANFKAGFVHVDIVAARHGIGGVDAQDPQAPTGFCKIIPCFDGPTKINLNNVPDGYRVAPPVASVATGEGALQLFSGETLRAAREDEPAADLPGTARFAVTATMRSGALVRTKKEFFRRLPVEIIPINSYAQFVVKYTVAMVPEEIVVVGDEQIAPDPERLVETEAAVPKEEKGWFAELLDTIKSLSLPWLIGIGVVVLAIFVPGFLMFVNALFKLLTVVVNAITRLFKGK